MTKKLAIMAFFLSMSLFSQNKDEIIKSKDNEIKSLKDKCAISHFKKDGYFLCRTFIKKGGV